MSSTEPWQADKTEWQPERTCDRCFGPLFVDTGSAWIKVGYFSWGFAEDQVSTTICGKCLKGSEND